MEAMLKKITQKKQQLDGYRPFKQEFERNMHEWTRIALTYSSNAIEGNTLSHQETALIVEKNTTVGGKTVVEHLEAINHAQAIDLITAKAKSINRKELSIQDSLDIHRCILQNIDSTHAGVFRECSVRITGSMVPRPNYLKVPELMNNFMNTVTTSTDHIAKIAADAHLRFVHIHPFVDGNGRTARLFFNLLLLQEGYPLAIIEKEDRLAYINAIETALLHEKLDDYYLVMFEGIERSLDLYLEALKVN